MDKRWRLVGLFVFNDIAICVLNGWLAWQHRGVWSGLLLINCVGIVIAVWSTWDTVQYIRVLLKLRWLEKQIAILNAANKCIHGEE